MTGHHQPNPPTQERKPLKFKLQPKTIAAVALVLSAGVAYLAFAPSANVAAAKLAIENRMKDPSSVQYRGITEWYPDVVCGQFNAKNGMGAYSGFEQFIYTASSDQIEFSPAESRMHACSNYAKESEEMVRKLEKTLRK